VGYLHISNLHRDQRILRFPECYALEKIHGTSAHVAYTAEDDSLFFFHGGASAASFGECFPNKEELKKALWSVASEYGVQKVTVYGEAYGGSMHKMSLRYGPKLRFVAFDVMFGEKWLTVVEAHGVAFRLGLEFVHYTKIPTTIEAIDAERDAPSVQAQRNGVEGVQPREGVVLRPFVEVVGEKGDGDRLICKHKRPEANERATSEDVLLARGGALGDKQRALLAGQAAVDEFVTEERLSHVLDHLAATGVPAEIESTGKVISVMIEDVMREGAGELADTSATKAAIAKKTRTMFHTRLAVQFQQAYDAAEAAS
jgi:hypothetical protein